MEIRTSELGEKEWINQPHRVNDFALEWVAKKQILRRIS